MPPIVLPRWAPSLRNKQSDAIQGVLESFNAGSNVVILDAPTGSGKTLIADIVRQSLLPRRSIYLCSSLSLQEQFRRDFPDAAILKGRSNYPTLDHGSDFNPWHPESSLSCADCTKKRNDDDEWECSWCSNVFSCPYESAKYLAIRNPTVCTNTHYWLYEANYVGTMGGRYLVVIDEADTLESTLMSFVEFNLPDRKRQEYGLPFPAKKTVEEAWEDWAKESAAIVDDLYRQSTDKLPRRPSLPEIRRHKSLERLSNDFLRLNDPNNGIPSGNWVYTGYNDKNIIFKPVRVSNYCFDYLWRHGTKFLLMSATVISSDELAESLGIR